MIRKIFTYIFILVILLFFVRYVHSNWESLKGFDFSLNWGVFSLSLFIWMLSYSGFAFLWRKTILLIDSNATISKKDAFRFYTLTEFAKYIPGSVWTVFSRTYYGRELNTSRKNILAASGIDAVLTAAIVLVLGAVFLTIHFSGEYLYLVVPSVVIALVGFVALHPKIFFGLANFVLKKMNKDPMDKGIWLSYRKIFNLSIGYSVLYIINSTAFFLFVSSIVDVSISNFFLVTSAYCLSIGLGIAAFFAPSGIGVREGVMTYLLGLLMTTPIALAISVFTRIWMTIGEVLLLLFSVLWIRFSKKKLVQVS